jgi:hypothetical protein
MPNVNNVAITKREAWSMAQDELMLDRNSGNMVTKIGSQEWQVLDGDTEYVCEIVTCHEVDCVLLSSLYGE